MPIRKSREARTKVTHTNAHSVIASIRIEDLESRVHLTVNTYADMAAKNAGGEPVETSEFIISGVEFTTFFADPILSQNRNSPVSQGYEYLKTLAEFSGGVDE